MQLPILATAEQKAVITEALKICGDKISNRPDEQISLMGGVAGDLLFLYKLKQFDPTLVCENVFEKKFDYLQEVSCSQEVGPNLTTGISGVGWCFEYLNQQQEEDYDPTYCEPIDDVLLQALSVSEWNGDIEALFGLAGFSAYGARRLMKAENIPYYAELLNHFEAKAINISPQHIAWSQPYGSICRINTDRNVNEFNLGLAHGVPGVIAALIPALKIPSLKLQAKSMLIKSCDWLISQEIKSSDRISYFSTSSDTDSSSRLGWCYGDLPIALTLVRVGNALEIPTYIDKAVEISLHAATRKSDTAQIVDAGLCHGGAGVSLIFQLLHKHLQLPELYEAAQYWLDFTLQLFKKYNIVGFHNYRADLEAYEEDLTLLSGFSGTGLCLLAAINSDTDWVDCLLMA